jgi:hypothetical protein
MAAKPPKKLPNKSLSSKKGINEKIKQKHTNKLGYETYGCETSKLRALGSTLSNETSFFYKPPAKELFHSPISFDKTR